MSNYVLPFNKGILSFNQQTYLIEHTIIRLEKPMRSNQLA